VKFAAEEQSFIADALKTVRWLGLTLGGLMLLTSGILIYNAIRMTVMARRREIRIMQLVGATRFMVWAPMLMEGVVQGAVGGTLAALVLWSAHNIVQQTVVRNLSAFTRMPPFPVAQAFVLLGVAGAVYGFVCSIVAVREPLQILRRPA
jgi:cell division transport system permease protein